MRARCLVVWTLGTNDIVETCFQLKGSSYVVVVGWVRGLLVVVLCVVCWADILMFWGTLSHADSGLVCVVVVLLVVRGVCGLL